MAPARLAGAFAFLDPDNEALLKTALNLVCVYRTLEAIGASDLKLQ